MSEHHRDEPRWVTKAVVLAVHDAQLAEHGGGRGVRDEGLLETALDRPKNRYHYMQPEEAAGAQVSTSDIATLAAAYAYGIAKNHPFVDGNKRTSFVVCELFLALNGYELTMDDATAVTTWLALAASELSEDELADRIAPLIQEAAD
ncbi:MULTISPECIES: type II toxin-antitoxin system death-on-curing family toxin [unclassified Xanthobacter]|uniref:type II toxin-antitoxin system death-on-curing family toxin n=1 Tax=unclassified Xanthobacter TaxID=2623496 RepID=UPI001EE0B971|nr:MULTISPECIES: type II toxin-antitoxin system death-on-curing family toxin [unclassified Xanthobacter]